MKLNTRIRYGLRMVVTIALHHKVINTTELSSIMKVSPKYLRKLAGPLEKAGIIKSVQGIYGGYTLNQKPEAIELEKIMNALGETFFVTDCLKKTCPLSTDCLTRPIWLALEQVLQKKFLSITLKDILDKRMPSV